MKKWHCEICNKYIRVDLDKIEKGEEVCFKVYEDGIYVKYLTGKVLHVDLKYFFIKTECGLHRIYKFDAYPKNAPVNFIYNMFGVCMCED